jgi:DNA-directed RNA polymerase specialized sigma24 family protein
MALGRQSMTATPLTWTDEAGELYRRPSDVEVQLDELCRRSPSEQLSCAKVTEKGSPLYVRNECLVYLLSQAVAADDSERYQAVADILLKRLIQPVDGQLRLLGVADDDVADLHQDVVLAMTNAIAKDQSGQFYQVKFGLALRRQLVKTYDSDRRRKRRSEGEQSLNAPVGGSEGGEDDGSMLGDFIESAEDVAENVERRILVREAVSSIKNPKHRKAFVLYHYHGWQIESNDPEEQTLSQLFERTPEMIRIWLRTAERQVAEWRAAKSL